MGYTSPRRYVLTGNFTAVNPVDATIYYVGGAANTMNTSIGLRETVVPISGFIRAAYIYTYSVTAAGTGEDWTWVIRNTTTAVDHAFTMLAAAAARRIFSSTTLNIPVTKDDLLVLKTTTPTWVTNPEGTQGYYWILIESE